MCALVGDTLAPHAPGLAAVLLPEATAGRVWEGKEALVDALGALAAACPAALAADPGTAPLVAALLGAAGKRRPVYRAAALGALEQLLTALADVDAKQAGVESAGSGGGPLAGAGEAYTLVAAPLLEAVGRHVSGPTAAEAAAAAAATSARGAGVQGGATAKDAPPEVAGEGDADGPPPPLPLAESLRVLAAAWRVAPAAVRASEGGRLFASLGGVLSRPGLPWAAWLAASGAADTVLQGCAAGGGGGKSSVQLAWLPPLLRGLAHCLANSTVSQVGAAH